MIEILFVTYLIVGILSPFIYLVAVVWKDTQMQMRKQKELEKSKERWDQVKDLTYDQLCKELNWYQGKTNGEFRLRRVK